MLKAKAKLSYDRSKAKHFECHIACESIYLFRLHFILYTTDIFDYESHVRTK